MTTIIDRKTAASAAKPYLSPSQLQMYCRCGEQYRRRYICKEIIPPGIAMHVGSGLHAGAEVNFNQKIESHTDLSPQEIIDAAVAGFDARIARDGYQLSEEEASIGAGKVLGQARDTLVGITEIHAKQQAPDYQPVAVEIGTRIELPDASHDLYGIADLWDDHARVVDLKTASRKKPQSEASKSLQLTFYAAAYAAINGELPSECRLDVVTTTKRPDRQVLATKRTLADIHVLVARVNAMLDGLAKGSFPPALPDAWHCSIRWCGYALTCPYYNAESDMEL